jgi:TetR/AcrR family transcriptional regulator, ethionamide resistance regulator
MTARRPTAPRGRGKDRTPRQRRDRESAEQQLLDAAEQLLRESSLRELTPLAVTTRAAMSRTSFYVYFSDISDLIVRLGGRLEVELADMTNRWVLGTGDIRISARGAIEGVVQVFREHGRVLRAMADAAPHDDRIEAVYVGIVEGFIDMTAQMIATEIAAGRISPLPVRETAAALIWMNERVLSRTFGTDNTGVDVDAVIEALLSIWVRALYQIDPLATTD